MPQPFRVVVIGGVAAGPKIASKVRRLRPDSEVTVIERSDIISYAGCGLPYYIAGVVPDRKELLATPAGAVRDAAFFKTVKDITVRTGAEALELDRANKRVRVRRLADGGESWIEYDKLALATGARANRPRIPGADLPNVFTLKTIADAEALRQLVEQKKTADVVLVGGGLIGLELAEAFAARGVRVTMIEMLDQLLAPLDREMALLVERHLTQRGVRVLTNTKVKLIEDRYRAYAPTHGVAPADPDEKFILELHLRARESYAESRGMEKVRLSEIKVTPELLGSIDPKAALTFHVFPVRATGDTVHVAFAEPYGKDAIVEELESRLRKKVVVALAPEDELARMIATHYAANAGELLYVETDRHQRIACDAVVFAVGIRPNVELAQAAGLELGPTGAIRVDDRLRTSDPDIYAAGDCVEVVNLVTGKPAYVPLGSTSNKQGRVAAVNLCGGDERFPGVLGSTICKVFDWTVGWTGLSEGEARKAGYDAVTCLVPGPDKAHYFPGRKMLMLKLVADRATGRLLGVQATGPGDAAKRLDVAATALTARMTVDQVAQLDLTYAPPYSGALDNLITAANVIKNKLAGDLAGVSPVELARRLDGGEDEDIVLLDVRTPAEFEGGHLRNAVHIPLGELRRRAGELPRDKEIVVYCGSSLRAYEGALILRAAGYEHVKVLDGSVAMWPYELVKGSAEC